MTHSDHFFSLLGRDSGMACHGKSDIALITTNVPVEIYAENAFRLWVIRAASLTRPLTWPPNAYSELKRAGNAQRRAGTSLMAADAAFATVTSIFSRVLSADCHASHPPALRNTGQTIKFLGGRPVLVAIVTGRRCRGRVSILHQVELDPVSNDGRCYPR
jgi:hypothetical protein